MKTNQIDINSLNRYKVIMLFGLLLSCAEYGLGLFSTDEGMTTFYIIQLMFFFVISYIGSVKHFGYLHLFSLLHLTTFFFALGCLAVGGMVDRDISFRYGQTPLAMRFQEEVVQKAIVLYLTYISSTSFFYFVLHNKNDLRRVKEKHEYKESSFNEMYFTIGKYLMWISFPLEMIYSVKMMFYGLLSRTAIFADGGVELPFYLRVANQLFFLGFYILIASNPPRKKLNIYFVLYMISLVPILMMGERGDFIVPIVFYIWYTSRFYSAKYNFRKLGLLGGIILIGSYFIQFTRLGADIDDTGLKVIPNAFNSLATSFSLMCYYITYKTQVIAHPYPFIFDGLIAGLIGVSGQSYETLEHRASIGHQLVYTINPEYYFSGASTGTAYIAEGYEFGIFGVIIACFVLAVFIKFFDLKAPQSNYLKIFLFYGVQQILLSPRGTLFIGILDIIKCSIVLLLCSFAYKFFTSNRKKTKLYEES